MVAKKLHIACPECKTRLTVDAATGEVLWHEAQGRGKGLDLREMVKGLEAQRQQAHQRVAQEQQALKERSRLLEEKVKEAMKRVDKDATPPPRPIDLD